MSLCWCMLVIGTAFALLEVNALPAFTEYSLTTAFFRNDASGDAGVKWMTSNDVNFRDKVIHKVSALDQTISYQGKVLEYGSEFALLFVIS